MEQKLKNWTFESRIMQNEWCTPATAVIYSFMLNRYFWFKGKKLDYFESMEEIAEATHISIITVKRSIALLEDKEFLFATKIRTGRFYSNKYYIKDVYGTYANLPAKKDNDGPSW
jgi:hypothetical protein